MVTTMSAHSARSSVSCRGTRRERSIPTSRMASTTTGWTCCPGCVPSDRAWCRPWAACSNRAWLICDRPALCRQANRTRAMLGDGVEQRPRRRLELGAKAVVGPDAFPGDLDQAGRSQLAHVMRDGRLREIECRREVADTDRFLRAFQHADHLEAGGVSP